MTMSPMSFTRCKLGNTHSKKGNQDGKRRVPQFLHVLRSPGDVWARQCAVLRLVCRSSHCSSHRCPHTTHYNPCVCRDATRRAHVGTLNDRPSRPINSPYRCSFIGSITKIGFTLLCPPFSLSGVLCVHISGASEMISCFRLASEPLSTPWLSVC